MLRTFAESGEGLILLEKCRILSMKPSEVLELQENEDDFLTHAIIKRGRRE